MDFITKVGDTRHALKADLSPAGGAMADVSRVDFHMSTIRGENVIAREVNVLSGSSTTFIFTAEEIAKEGEYLGEYRLTYNDGKVEHIPADSYIQIKILKNLKE